MKKSKVIAILRTLSPDELKKFRDFVHSPFHNKNKNVIRLFEIIRKHYPKFEESVPEKEKVFKKLFPGKKFNDTVIRILLSDLLKICEEFLSYINFKKNSQTELRYLLYECKERNLDSLFRMNFKSAENSLEGPGNTDITYFLKRYELETAEVNYLISRDRQSQTGVNVIKQGEYLLCFFLAGILNIAHELKVQKDVVNAEFDFNLADKAIQSIDLEGIMKYMKENNFRYYPVISIYYNMYLSYINEDRDEYYNELKKLVDDNFEMFTRDEKVNLMIILENICLSKTSKGNLKFFADLMEIYRKMLSGNIYLHSEKEYFQINLFRNMFYTAVIQKEFKWAEKFIKEHINELSPEQKEDMEHYSKAVLYFEKNNFVSSLEEICKVKYKYFVYKYDVKLLMLKSYYELGYFENALFLIDSFSHFLSKNRTVSVLEKERFGNFLLNLKSLIKIKTGSASGMGDDLYRSISGIRVINSRKWLMEKAKELAKSKK